MRQSRVQGLYATHRQACQRTALTVALYAEVLLYERDAIVEQFPFKVDRVSVCHDDEHRDGFPFGYQVVHDDIGASLGRPASLIFAATVLQVEHRITLLIHIVAGWTIEIGRASCRERV